MNLNKGLRNNLKKFARKWDSKKLSYEQYEIPDGASLSEDDMQKIIICASCAEEMKYGDGFTSRTIHTKLGLGYVVCEECYFIELNKEMSADE